jgi:hypothetical protein
MLTQILTIGNLIDDQLCYRLTAPIWLITPTPQQRKALFLCASGRTGPVLATAVLYCSPHARVPQSPTDSTRTLSHC